MMMVNITIKYVYSFASRWTSLIRYNKVDYRAMSFICHKEINS